MGGIAKASLLWIASPGIFECQCVKRSSVKSETGTGLFCHGMIQIYLGDV